MKKKWWIFHFIFLALASAFLGFLIGEAQRPEPEVITEFIPQFVPEYIPYEKPVFELIEKPVYIDRPVYETITVEVEREVEVEKEVYVSGSFREFESLAQFTEWVEGQLTLLFPSGAYKVDCDDYAERLQQKAYQDGYLLSCHLVENGKIFGKRVSDNRDCHMGNLVMIGNDIYFVEPQPEIFRIVKICERD